MDLPGLSGVELIARITEPPVKFSCLAHTVSAERETVFAAIQMGACGYVLKGAASASWSAPGTILQRAERR